MTIEEIIYDILEIKNATGDDADIDELFLLQKINSYRAVMIQNHYSQRGYIDSSWIQRYPVFDFEKVLSSDDPNIGWGSINLGKYTLPKIISLPEQMGLFQVFGSARARPLSLTDFSTMIMRAGLDEELPKNSGWISLLGNDIYVYPYLMKGQAHIIAENPMEVPIIENGVKRNLTETDEYPLDAGIAQAIILEILTKDLNILKQEVSDIVNDAQSELKILKNAAGFRQNTGG